MKTSGIGMKEWERKTNPTAGFPFNHEVTSLSLLTLKNGGENGAKAAREGGNFGKIILSEDIRY